MILSFAVYLILACSLYILAKQIVIKDRVLLRTTGSNAPFGDLPTILSILIFALICGVRYNVGVDNLSYIRQYTHLQQTGNLSRDNFEPLFGAVANICASLNLHFSIFMGFWAGLQLFFVYYSMRRDKYLLPFLALFIVLGPTFLSWTNGLRQTVVICIFTFLIEYIVAHKLWHYVIGILICSCIHKSAIILLPFYFVFQKPLYFKSRSLNISIAIVCTILGMNPGWIYMVNDLKGVLAFMDYGNYADQLELITENADQAMAWGPARVGLYILDILAIALFPKIKEIYRLDKRFDIYFCAFLFGTFFFNLFANTSHIFLRPIAYFRDFRLIIVPVCLYYLFKERRYALFSLMAVLAFFYTLYASSKAFVSGLGEKAPEVYKFFFLENL